MQRDPGTGKITHTFRPFAFCWSLGESTAAFLALFRCTILAMECMGYADFEESIGSCVADHCPGAYAAWRVVFPGVCSSGLGKPSP
jgi:hypothetical protein